MLFGVVWTIFSTANYCVNSAHYECSPWSGSTCICTLDFFYFTDWSCSMQIGYMTDRIFILEIAKIKTTLGVLILRIEMRSFLQMFTLSHPQIWRSFNWCARSIMFLPFSNWRPGSALRCLWVLSVTGLVFFLSPLSPATWIIFFKHGCHHFLISFAVSRPSSTRSFHFIVCVYL